MCGRYTFWHGKRELDTIFQASLFEELAPRYDIRPTQTVPIVRQRDGGREWGTARWGLLPGWVQDPKKFTTLFNARAEGLAEKPSFRTAYKKRRCLVPASGFYEWKGRTSPKQRYYIGFRDRSPLALAGLWESWEKDGEAVHSCTIITTAANTLMRELHDRMPVILSPEQFDLWLDPEEQDTERLEPLLAPYEGQEMEAYPVGNFPGEDPRLLEPIEAP